MAPDYAATSAVSSAQAGLKGGNQRLETEPGLRCCRGIGSAMRSGCGIIPSTRRFSDRMPAMSRGRAIGVVAIAERDPVFGVEQVKRCRVGEIISVVMRDGKRSPLIPPHSRG